jgi:heterodisulfide reductase subunit C
MAIKINNKTIDNDFINKIEEISGQPIHKCMQCGTCSGGCPMNKVVDLSPRRIVQMSNFGLRDIVESANTAWVCASCHTCLVRCPRGLDLPRIMEAIRLLTLRKNKNYIEPMKIKREEFEDMPQIALVSCFRKHTA